MSKNIRPNSRVRFHLVRLANFDIDMQQELDKKIDATHDTVEELREDVREMKEQLVVQNKMMSQVYRLVLFNYNNYITFREAFVELP